MKIGGYYERHGAFRKGFVLGPIESWESQKSIWAEILQRLALPRSDSCGRQYYQLQSEKVLTQAAASALRRLLSFVLLCSAAQPHCPACRGQHHYRLARSLNGLQKAAVADHFYFIVLPCGAARQRSSGTADDGRPGRSTKLQLWLAMAATTSAQLWLHPPLFLPRCFILIDLHSSDMTTTSRAARGGQRWRWTRPSMSLPWNKILKYSMIHLDLWALEQDRQGEHGGGDVSREGPGPCLGREGCGGAAVPAARQEAHRLRGLQQGAKHVEGSVHGTRRRIVESKGPHGPHPSSPLCRLGHLTRFRPFDSTCVICQPFHLGG